MEKILGYIEHIIFQNQDNGFIVAKLKEDSKKGFTTIVGLMPSVQSGENLELQGEWKNHPSFGKQFEVKEYTITAPSNLIGIEKYLESGLVKGVGPVYAKKIVKKFGLETLDVIEKTPLRLLEIPGLGKKKIKSIKQCFDEQQEIRNVMIFLRSHDVSPGYAQKIFKTYKDKSISFVKKNPYRLAKEIVGIGFKIADRIAQKLGFELNDPLRISSGIEYVLFELTSQGHTCFPEEDFLPLAEKILEVDLNLIKNELDHLIKKNQLIKDILHEKSFLFLKSLYFFEQNIAQELNRIGTAKSFLRSFEIEKAMTWIQNKLNLKFAENQIEAIDQAITQKLHIITGGPGTGKSTIVNAILNITKELTNKIILAAPTGRAAKRLTQITEKKAFTIHALLEYDFANGTFKKNQDNPIKCDLIILDEASMIDTMLMYNLLRAIPSSARVVFVGDVDQLPSVGPGNVLKDMILSEKIGLSRLTDIFRQAAHSKIILNAHRINEGKFPEISNAKNSDFHFISLENPEDIQNKILELVEKEIPEKKRLHPINDIQVLAPMKRGIIGTENLNTILQNTLNPSSKPLFRAGQRFHENDKVMQIKNNYNKDVYNGDVGKIIKIDTVEQLVIIAFDGNFVSYEFSELDEVVLAYAVSVHKYQGSECPCIIVPIHTCHYKLLYRNLLYTAITRGKKFVVLLGTVKAIAIAIKNEDVMKRYTGLENSIRSISSKAQDTWLPGFSV